MWGVFFIDKLALYRVSTKNFNIFKMVKKTNVVHVGVLFIDSVIQDVYKKNLAISK